jgi:acetolactate synthase-1/2/3 large subunit
MSHSHRVVDHIVGYLASIGVDYIFGVDGGNIEDLYDAAFFHSDISAVLAKHEFSAAAMADGYRRSGGGFGVVAASGVGALNLVACLEESSTSRMPLLALVGQPAHRLGAARRRGGGANGRPCGVVAAQRRSAIGHVHPRLYARARN